ncbi:MAG: hypothetical protein LBU62_09175 [Bacteroidales bacterium]|jgi:hypothetical protein|nr:hypothetical protein [Bacteroidales bacterium]
MKRYLMILAVIVFTVPSFVSCKKDKTDNLEWSPIQESKFVTEGYNFQFEGKTITGELYVEVEDLEGKVATVEVAIRDAKVNGSSIGGDFIWAEIIDNGNFVGIDDDWTGAYDSQMDELEKEWCDLIDRLVLKYKGV